MFGSAVLESLIALAFLYLLLSVVCSAFNEFISRWLKLRHKTLLKGLGHLLEDPKMRQALLNHPLIRVLGDDPSHIPPRTFALALLDTIAPAGQVVSGTASPASSDASSAANGSAAVVAKTASGSEAVAEQGDKGEGESKVESSTTLGPPLGFDQVREAIGNLPDCHFRSALLTLVDSTDQELDSVRTAVGNWFDSTMDRASEWYKQRTHWVLLILAALISIGINADTLEIAETLWRDSGLRQGLVAAADDYVSNYRNVGTTPGEVAAVDPEAAMKSLRDQLSSFNLTLGWKTVPSGFRDWSAKLMGLLLTTVAVSLGAPFWFDVVNKVILARGSASADTKTTS